MIGDILRVRYEITQPLGDHPLFTIVTARDRLMNKDVCLRLLKAPFKNESDFVSKLGEVVQKGSNLNHPGIQRLLSLDSDESQTFLVSDLPVGTSLLERIQKLAPFSVPVSVGISISILEALSSMHAQGFVHGDVGAHNVNIGNESETQLELPCVWEAFASSDTAGAVMLRAMAPYMAPEISSGAMPTMQSDVYAAGVILFELLTGRTPYRAETPLATVMKHGSEPVPSVKALNPSVPTALDELLKKAMSKRPQDRYPTAAEMLSDLRILQDALRFGRTLSWPIQGSIRTSSVAPAEPVAPKMSAVREEKKPKEPREEYEEDVPVWVKTLVAFLMGLVAVMVIGWIIFNVNKPKTIVVPRLQGLTVTEATQKLKSLSLKLQIIDRKPNEQIPADQIIDESPVAGDKIYEGGSVGVIVSRGSQFVEVPDVRGVSVDKAKLLLGSVSLTLDDNVEKVRAKDVEEGMIVSQLPEARKKVERDTAIRVKVSSGKSGDASNDPSSGDKYLYTVHIKLSGINEGVKLRVDMTDAQGTKTVHEDSDQYPGDEVDVTAEGFGDEVTFRIFYDGELVKQVVKKANEEDKVQ